MLKLGNGRYVNPDQIVEVLFADEDVDDELPARALVAMTRGLPARYEISDPAYAVLKAWCEHKPVYHYVAEGDLPDFYRYVWIGYKEYTPLSRYVTIGRYCLISTHDWVDSSSNDIPAPDWWCDLGDAPSWPEGDA